MDVEEVGSMNRPSFFRRSVIWVVDSWRYVMDVRFNPLKYIPDPSLQAYFMLVLFVMWSAFFGIMAVFYMGLINYSIVTSIFVHMAILIPIVITNAIFVDAEREGSRWVQEWREEQSRFLLFTRRASNGVRILWDIDKEA